MSEAKEVKWISVEERLPQLDGFTLVYGNSGHMIRWYSGLIKGWDRCQSKNLSHWMPLPTPPKPDQP